MLVSKGAVRRNSERSHVKDTRKFELSSLSQIAKYSPYSQEYLSLQARNGFLKAKKIGRNWVSSRQWLEEYLENHSLKSS